ncbi:MAG: hypothetical protein IPN33_00170 [Saprospiraceae bacterium]|nr:hypothetical protein [Saprospiraceae bacterium]
MAPNYFQVYKTDFEGSTLKDDRIVFEDKNCIVSYNLWDAGGDIGFNIYNKTENYLTVDLTKTFFVLNGVAYAYFQNRIFSNSSNTGTTITAYNSPIYWNYNLTKVAGTSSSGTSTSYIEKPELTIPSATSMNISEYHISNSRYFDCDLSKTPTKKNIKTVTI